MGSILTREADRLFALATELHTREVARRERKLLFLGSTGSGKTTLKDSILYRIARRKLLTAAESIRLRTGIITNYADGLRDILTLIDRFGDPSFGKQKPPAAAAAAGSGSGDGRDGRDGRAAEEKLAPELVAFRNECFESESEFQTWLEWINSFDLYVPVPAAPFCSSYYLLPILIVPLLFLSCGGGLILLCGWMARILVIR